MAWTKVANGAIRFKPIWNQKKPGPFHKLHDKLRDDQGIFLWKLDKNDNAHFTKSFRKDLAKIHGHFFNGPGENSAHIAIYINDISKEHFYQVALHEIGHLLHLSHITDNVKAIMYPSVTGSCITVEDAQYLCEVYGCSPRPEC